MSDFFFFLVASESSKLSSSEIFLVRFRYRSDFFLASERHQTRFVVALYDDACSFVFVVVGETSDVLCRVAEITLLALRSLALRVKKQENSYN